MTHSDASEDGLQRRKEPEGEKKIEQGKEHVRISERSMSYVTLCCCAGPLTSCSSLHCPKHTFLAAARNMIPSLGTSAAVCSIQQDTN